MRVIILGSAAGGGLPQWNCGCRNCQEARLSGTGRTQSSVAVSADGARWVLLNASPDLRIQVASRPELWPRGARGTPISAAVCTDGEIDHTLGLLLLAEAMTKLAVYAPLGVAGLLDREWPLFRILSAYAGLEPRTLPDGQAIALADAAGKQLGIACTAVPVARRPPRYARQAAAATYDVGLRLTDERTGRRQGRGRGTISCVASAPCSSGAITTSIPSTGGCMRASCRALSSSCGWRTASTTRSTFRSRTRSFCPTVRSPRSAAAGSSGSSITTGGMGKRAVSRLGCGWGTRWA